MPGEGPQETAFMREAGALEAKNFGSLVEMGQTSRRNRVILDQLDSSAATIPGGWQAVVQNELGNLGIDTEGLSEIQATEALINQLVPAQRQPGSGPMSDKDLALFKASLPRLIQTPEGKTRILNNMKAINDYVISEGEIGSRVLSGEITPEQGRAEMQALGNPLAGDPRTGAPTGPQKEDLKGLRAPDGDPVTEEDIAETMRKYNVSREAVIAHLRGQ
jgi:flagellar protein FlgJ